MKEFRFHVGLNGMNFERRFDHFLQSEHTLAVSMLVFVGCMVCWGIPILCQFLRLRRGLRRWAVENNVVLLRFGVAWTASPFQCGRFRSDADFPVHLVCRLAFRDSAGLGRSALACYLPGSWKRFGELKVILEGGTDCSS